MQNISIIGTGNMGEAIIRGLLAKSKDQFHITAIDKDKSKTDKINETYGIQTSNQIELSEVNIIAVKPNHIESLLNTVDKSKVSKDALYISVAAGVRTDTFKKILGQDIRVSRVMPNLPAIVGAGVNVIYSENKKDLEITTKIFNSIGTCYTCEKENEMNAATALSGSGPAFVSLFIQSLSIAAKENGLHLNTNKVAIETLMGTCKLLLEKNIEPEELIKMVSSPNGTTVAGLKSLNENNFKTTVKNAIDASTKRAFELE